MSAAGYTKATVQQHGDHLLQQSLLIDNLPLPAGLVVTLLTDVATYIPG